MTTKKTRSTDDRTRNWTFFVWPDSAPENWRAIIDEQHIQWAESPLHDQDLDVNGEKKKPHWHILLMFEGNKSYSQIKELTDKLNTTKPEKTASAKGLVRYMAHLDNPEKAQYNPLKIVGYGGIDIAEMLRPTSSCRYQLIAEMMDFVEDEYITEMKQLLRYARRERMNDWFPLLCDNSAYIINLLLKSNRHFIEKKPELKVDPETGEVLE